jgi:hypothetical protein
MGSRRPQDVHDEDAREANGAAYPAKPVRSLVQKQRTERQKEERRTEPVCVRLRQSEACHRVRGTEHVDGEQHTANQMQLEIAGLDRAAPGREDNGEKQDQCDERSHKHEGVMSEYSAEPALVSASVGER